MIHRELKADVAVLSKIFLFSPDFLFFIMHKKNGILIASTILSDSIREVNRKKFAMPRSHTGQLSLAIHCNAIILGPQRACEKQGLRRKLF